MSRGGSFQQTKTERDAEARRKRVRETVMALLEGVHSVSAADVYLALDHTAEPKISPANSGNILALLARQGILSTIMGRRSAGATRDAAILYTIPPRKRAILPVSGSENIRPLTKEELMVGRARPRRPRYVSMMEAPPDCVGTGEAQMSPLDAPHRDSAACVGHELNPDFDATHIKQGDV